MSVAAGPAGPDADVGSPGTIDPGLAAELAAGPWDHRWELAPGLATPVSEPGSRHADWTLRRMLEEPVADALALGAGGGTALDLGCGEGMLAHALIGLGAHVLGLEPDLWRLRRAELLRERLAIPAAALELRGAGAAPPAPVVLGEFDVVVLARRLVDASPSPWLRLARACTRRLCVIETAGPEPGSLAEAARAAGFATVSRVAPPADGERRYVLGERTVILARPEGP